MTVEDKILLLTVNYWSNSSPKSDDEEVEFFKTEFNTSLESEK